MNKEKLNNNLIAGDSSSAITYRGNVSISLVKGDRTIRTIHKHNVGCTPLFDFLINCLAGNYDGNELPKYLMGYHKASAPTTPSELGTQMFSALVPISNVEVSSTNKKTTFKFVIPSTYLTIDEQSLNVLGIYSTNNRSNLTNPSAYIFLNSDLEIKPSDFGSGVSVIVLWEMIFSNKE